MQNPEIVLKKLGLYNSEISVYLAMLQGVTSASDLVKVTRQKRPTVYYALTSLEKRGLISKTGKEGRGRFAVESLDRLQTIIKNRQREIAELSSEVTSFSDTFRSLDKLGDIKPAVAFFEGIDAIKNIIMEMPYCRGEWIYSVVPKENIFWQIGQGFVRDYVSLRVERNIHTKNIWEIETDQSVLQKYYSDLSEIRLLPEVMHKKFYTTTFLYDDRVLHISSLKNAYAILITSQEYHNSMKAWFDGLWLASKEYFSPRHPLK